MQSETSTSGPQIQQPAQLWDQLLSSIIKWRALFYNYVHTLIAATFKPGRLMESESAAQYLSAGAFLGLSLSLQYIGYLLLWPQEPHSTYELPELPKRVEVLLGLLKKIPAIGVPVFALVTLLLSTIFPYFGFRLLRTKLRFGDLLNLYAYFQGGPTTLFLLMLLLIFFVLFEKFALSPVYAGAFQVYFLIFVVYSYLWFIPQLSRLTNKSKIFCIMVMLISGLIPSSITKIASNNIFRSFKIPSGAMLPTIDVGDHLLTNNLILRFRQPRRGEIIVFTYPNYENDPEKREIQYIFRLIGLPGDSIDIHGRNLYINGDKIPLEYLGDFQDKRNGVIYDKYEENLLGNRHLVIYLKRKETTEKGNYLPVAKVPKGYIFAIGDNRDDSLDSRFWGFVPIENIIGVSYFRTLPLQASGPIN